MSKLPRIRQSHRRPPLRVERIPATPDPGRYVILLLSLVCLQSAHIHGDRVRLTFNDRTLWTSGKRRMHPRPVNEYQFSRYVFASAGARPILRVLNPALVRAGFELWEQRWLFGGWRIGAAPVSARDAAHGTITVVFAGGAARYALAYRVLAWSPSAISGLESGPVAPDALRVIELAITA